VEQGQIGSEASPVAIVSYLPLLPPSGTSNLRRTRIRCCVEVSALSLRSSPRALSECRGLLAPLLFPWRGAETLGRCQLNKARLRTPQWRDRHLLILSLRGRKVFLLLYQAYLLCLLFLSVSVPYFCRKSVPSNFFLEQQSDSSA